MTTTASGRSCPDCGPSAFLFPTAAAPFRLQCTQCGGALVPPEVSRQLFVERAALEPSVLGAQLKRAPRGTRACVECGQTPVLHRHHAGVAEVCLPCGTSWLAGHTVIKLLRTSAPVPPRPSPPHEPILSQAPQDSFVEPPLRVMTTDLFAHTEMFLSNVRHGTGVLGPVKLLAWYAFLTAPFTVLPLLVAAHAPFAEYAAALPVSLVALPVGVIMNHGAFALMLHAIWRLMGGNQSYATSYRLAAYYAVVTPAQTAAAVFLLVADGVLPRSLVGFAALLVGWFGVKSLMWQHRVLRLGMPLLANISEGRTRAFCAVSNLLGGTILALVLYAAVVPS